MYSSARFNDLDLALWEGISATNDKDACAFRIVITSSEIPISLRINYVYEDLCEDRPTKEDTVTATEAGLPEGKSAYFSHTKVIVCQRTANQSSIE